MYTKIEDVIAWLIVNRVENFKVYQAAIWEENKMDNKCILSCTADDETIDTKRENFINTMERYGSGEFIIKQADGNGKCAVCKLKIDSRDSQPKQIQQPQMNGFQPSGNFISRTEMEALLAKQKSEFEAQRMNDRLERLEAELKEAKKEASENSGAMTNFFKELMPLARPFVNGLMAKRAAQPVAIGALDCGDNVEPHEEEIDVTEEEFSIICQSINAWKKKDKDYIRILQKLPEFVDNPMYETAKNFILQ